MVDKVNLTKGQKQRLALLLRRTQENADKTWYGSEEFDVNHPTSRQEDLIAKGLIEENLDHGYRYRLTALGHEIVGA